MLTREQLKAQFHDKLSLAQLEDVYPESMGRIELVKLEDIKPLIDKIIQEAGGDLGYEEFGAIPSSKKIEFNGFSISSKNAIRRGLVRVKIVQSYIGGLDMPENAEKLQKAMRDKYKVLLDRGYKADDLLQELIKWIRLKEEDAQRAAALVIIAYFFESCDVFKNPADGVSNANAH